MKRSRLRPVNPERKAASLARNFGPQAALCRTLPCVACGARGPSDPAHVRTRGARGADYKNVIPLCRACHDLQGLGWWKLTAKPFVPVAVEPRFGQQAWIVAGIAVEAWAVGLAQGIGLLVYKRKVSSGSGDGD